MTFTPYITIYPEENFNYSWSGDNSIRATLIFSKNLEYNKKLLGKRVNIHLGNEERIHTDGSIKSIWIKNSIDTSVECNDIEKINTFLKIIYDSIMTIAEVEGWETKSFEKAYKLSISDNGNFCWYSELKSNKNRRLKARVKISLEKDGKVPVIAEFFDHKSNWQFEVPVIDTCLHFVDWERVFLKPAWIDNEKFGFNLIGSQLQIFANSVTKFPETIISEKTWTREEVEGSLRMLTFKIFHSSEDFVKWVSK